MKDQSTLRSLFYRVRAGAILGVIGALLLPTLVAAKSLEHVVRPGETLLQIALDYDVSLGELMTANQIANANQVRIGVTLLIPTTDSLSTSSERMQEDGASAVESEAIGASVTVRPGDTLSQIALNHGISPAELMALNGLTNPNMVHIGQRLQVPNRSTSLVLEEAKFDEAIFDETTFDETKALPEWQIVDTYLVQPGDSMSAISLIYNTSMSAILLANGLEDVTDVPVGRELLIPITTRTLALVDSTYAPPAGKQLIEVDLSQQTLTAWNGGTVILHTLISSGDAGTPTVLGRYLINTKLDKQDMGGSTSFYLPDVPWVMYFYAGYALHGAYWHNNFGLPMSHGCINILPTEAELLYDRADVGTEVFVHW